VVAVDVDRVAVETARSNARLNGLAAQLRLVHGGPEALFGSWPLVVANILAAPLIEMAPTLVRRVAGGGRVILSGIADAAAPDVAAAYRRLGMRELQGESRAGWRCLLLSASW
jgi:ribosomal protein L11 methyltransferase